MTLKSDCCIQDAVAGIMTKHGPLYLCGHHERKHRKAIDSKGYLTWSPPEEMPDMPILGQEDIPIPVSLSHVNHYESSSSWR